MVNPVDGRAVAESVRAAVEASSDLTGAVITGLDTVPAGRERAEILARVVGGLKVGGLRVAVLNCGSLRDLAECVLQGVELVGTDLCWKFAKEGKGIEFTFQGGDGIGRRGGGGKRAKLSEVEGLKEGKVNVLDFKGGEYTLDTGPMAAGCKCWACKKHTRAYVHHLLKVSELLGQILLFIHNLWAVLDATEQIEEGKGDLAMEKVWRERFEGV